MDKNELDKLLDYRKRSLILITMGVVLLVFMIVVEDEPGAVPLIFILAGTVWYLIINYKIRSQKP